MSTPLRLSHNELSALLKYMFQGMFGHAYDWGALAEYVLWLECRGFKGLALLMDALHADVLQGFSGTVTDTPQGYVIDFGGRSLLMGLPMIVDLAVDHTRRNKDCIIDIVSAEQPEALIAAEAAIYRVGLYGYAQVDTARLSCSSCPNTHDNQRDYNEAERLYSQSLQDGIMIDKNCYNTLTNIAGRTLVEASEASRRGAGE